MRDGETAAHLEGIKILRTHLTAGSLPKKLEKVLFGRNQTRILPRDATCTGVVMFFTIFTIPVQEMEMMLQYVSKVNQVNKYRGSIFNHIFG